jgi:hypothetical protein
LSLGEVRERLGETPSQPRTTLPLARARRHAHERLIGIAKPIPWPVETIAVLMPITLAPEVQQAHPSSRLMEASVWMSSRRDDAELERPVALMTPTVTVCSRPNGLPIAIAHSPTWLGSEFRAGRRRFPRTGCGSPPVGLGVGADDLAADLALGVEAHHDLVSALDDVEVGEDVPWASMITPEPTPADSRPDGAGIWPK